MASVIDKYLPIYSLNELHETIVNCPVERVYDVAFDFDLSKSRLIKFLFTLRGLPTARMNLQSFIQDAGFTHFEENRPYENVMGFWMRPKIEKVPSYDDFVDESIPSWVKAAWNFRFEETGENRTRVTTETRVLCVKPITRITFGLYWILVKPFSGLIRKEMLKIIKADAEANT